MPAIRKPESTKNRSTPHQERSRSAQTRGDQCRRIRAAGRTRSPPPSPSRRPGIPPRSTAASFLPWRHHAVAGVRMHRSRCSGPLTRSHGRSEKALSTRAARPYGARRRATRGATETEEMEQLKSKVASADGKLAVLLPGMGAVATTFIAGVEAVKAGLGKPIGSLTQMAHVRLGRRHEKRWAMIKDPVPPARLEDPAFGGWGPIPDDAYTAAAKAKVLSAEHLAQLKPSLSQIRPMAAVFDKNVVKRLEGANVKKGTRRELVNQLMQDIRGFMDKNKCTRAVMVWCASTEAYQEAGPEHQSIAAFEKALDADHPNIYHSQLYAYAAIMTGEPYLNGAPNMSCDVPALVELAEQRGVAIRG